MSQAVNEILHNCSPLRSDHALRMELDPLSANDIYLMSLYTSLSFTYKAAWHHRSVQFSIDLPEQYSKQGVHAMIAALEKIQAHLYVRELLVLHSHNDAIFCPSSYLQILWAAVLVDDQAVIPSRLKWVWKALSKSKQYCSKIAPHTRIICLPEGTSSAEQDFCNTGTEFHIEVQTSFLSECSRCI